jgi:hypothetical protein
MEHVKQTMLQVMDRFEIGMTDSPTMLTSPFLSSFRYQIFWYISGFVAYIWNGAAHNTLPCRRRPTTTVAARRTTLEFTLSIVIEEFAWNKSIGRTRRN